jgi:hypothetical protein
MGPSREVVSTVSAEVPEVARWKDLASATEWVGMGLGYLRNRSKEILTHPRAFQRCYLKQPRLPLSSQL